MFDLTLLPIHLIDGSEQMELPGFYAANAPRRAARGRAGDQLLIMLTLLGNAPLSPDGLKQLLDRLTDQYFQTSGSVTSALRSTADTLNQFLLDRNLRNTSTGRQAIGLLNIAVLHGTSLYICHGGPTHSYLLSPGSTQHWYDAQTGGRGLGLSRSTPLRYYQVEIQPGDRLLMSPEPPATWAPVSMSGTSALTLDQLRRRLLSLAKANLNAALVHFQTGTGKIQLFQSAASAASASAAGVEMDLTLPDIPLPATPSEPVPAPEPLPSEVPTFNASILEPAAPASANGETPVEVAASDAEITPPVAETIEPAQPAGEMVEPPVATDPPHSPLAQASPASLPQTPSAPVRARTAAETPRPKPQRAERPPRPKPNPIPVFRFLAGLVRGGRRVREQSGQGLRGFLARLSPGGSNQPASLSPITMVFIAIAVPVVIVTVALYIYNQKGRAQEYNGYYSLAVQSALQTQNQTDPNVLRAAWSQTLYWLDKAEQQESGREETDALRKQAQSALDQLDVVVRLNYQPAIIGGLSSGAIITQVIANSSDIYLLNSTAGLVVHALLTGKGYEIDPTFNCGKGPYGGILIGDLIHMAPMPRGNEFSATILAVDANGNVLFCGPGVNPTSTTLGQPDNNWGKITAITLDEGVLYVLDSQNNAVWVYNSTGSFRDKPHLYFGAEVPPLADTIDLEVNQGDMLLLHQDGHLTQCSISNTGEYNTHCTDPSPYSDPRPGRQSSVAAMPEASLGQMQHTQPPDPSLYLLDSNTGSIYQFSLRLNYQRQFRSLTGINNPFPAQPATTFAISPNQMAFVAFGNQVFYAVLP